MIPPTAMPTAPLALGVQLTMRGSTSDYSGARLDDLKRDIAQKAGVPVAAIADLRVAAGTVSFTIPKVGGQELVAGMTEHATRGSPAARQSALQHDSSQWLPSSLVYAIVL